MNRKREKDEYWNIKGKKMHQLYIKNIAILEIRMKV